ncbi:hypothetical protein Pcinc_031007 [Petrolisthes cinctipes]|uniref:FAD dependent oxidoreductase domain-containing protein n=1 Tax=Petrolisthes cinctipes TaxID=88211 RepID=A0AAE1EX68_PETCI|nr:hypothetical protein Pcinc_031007 [Petrolisthes cinctipes]
MQTRREVEVAVVGAGVIGTSAALALQRSGKKTLLIEQYQFGGSHGSSGGGSRIVHYVNTGCSSLASILQDAMKRWRELDDEVDDQLLVSPMKMLMVGKAKETVEKLATSVQDSCSITPSQANSKYKTEYSEEYTMFEYPGAAVLRADLSRAALLRLYQESGGEVLEGWKVAEIAGGEEDGRVRVRGPNGEVRASSVVLCPGPWAGYLLHNLGVDLPLQPIKSRVCFYQRGEFPDIVLLDSTDVSDMVYLLPALDIPNSLKVGYSGVEVHPDDPDPDLSRTEEEVKEYVAEHLSLGGKHSHQDCWYTNTPDKTFILDHHPTFPNIVYAVGFSGRGFTVAPTIGHILACMVTGRDHGFNISPFSASRFSTEPKSMV